MVLKTPQTRVLFGRCRNAAWLLVLGVFFFSGITAFLATGVNPQPVSAATNNNLNFQARLQNAAGGIVADGYYNIQFKLYDANELGNNLWTETYYDANGSTTGSDNRVRVKNGYVSVNLGSQTAFPGTIDWSQELWLTMNIGGTSQVASPTWDGEMNPRLKVTGVPYAFKAAKAGDSDTLDGLDSTAFAAATGSGSYIQNGTNPQTADFNVTGNGTIGGDLTVAGTIEATTGYSVNGTAGATTTCSGGQFLQNAVIEGGIVTDGGCAAATSGVTAIGVVDSQTKAADGAVIVGTTLYLQTADETNPGLLSTEAQTIAGAKTFTGAITASGGISGDGSGLTGLDASNLATGTVGTGLITGSYTGITGTGALAAGSIASGFGTIETDNTITGTSINGTTGINTGTGAGTQRIDASGNLVNIGNISSAGTIQSSATSGVSYIMTSLGLGVTNPQGAMTVANNAWISALNAAGDGYVNILRVNSDDEIEFGTGLSIAGGIEFPTNAGQVTFADLPIDGAALAGVPQSYTFKIGTTNALTVYGEADGSGNAQNLRVAIGSSISPDYTLDVGGDINTTTGYRVGGTAGATTTCSGGQFLQNAVISGGIVTSGTCTAASNGVTTVGTFSDTTSIANGASISGNTITFGAADATNPGMISTGAQTIAGAKTFTGDTSFSTKIGVGTSSPAEALDVRNGAIRVGYTTDTFDQLLELWRNDIKIGAIDNNAGDVRLRALNNNKLQLTNDDGNGLTLEDDGDIAIGASTAGYKLDVQGGDINTSGAYRVGGTAGATTTCSGGQFLQNAVISGGIITSGTCTAASNGVTTVGTINGQTKSDNGAVIVGTSIYLQTADASKPGLVSTGTQAFAGDKTFNGNVTIGDATSDRLTITAHLLGGSPIVLQGATDNGFATTIALVDPTANNTITLPNASGTVAVSASGPISLNSTTGALSLGTVGVANGGTGSTSYTTNGVVYYNGSSLVSTGAGSTDQCLKSTTGSSPTWGTCGTATTLQDAYSNSATTDPQITLNSSYGGLSIADSSGGVTGNLFQIQNNAGTTTLFGISASAMTLQNSSGNAMTFDTTTNRLRIYDPSNQSNYAELYYDHTNSEAVFAASSGTTRIGNGSGNIILQMSTAADVLQATKTASLASAYSGNDFTFTRNISAGANSLTGAVLKVESTSSGSSTLGSTILHLNENSGSATGNLILATTGGSTERFKVTDSGATTVGGLLTGSAGMTVTGGNINLNTSGSSTINIGTGTSTGNVNLGNQSGGNTVTISANNFTVDATGNFAGVDNLIMGGKLNADVSDANGLRVRNSTGAISLLNIDSTGSGTTGLSLQIGSSTTDANAVELVLDSYNGSSDPTGVNGAMYYNTSKNKFRCYQAGQWYDCLGINPDYNRARPIYSTDFLDNGNVSAGLWQSNSMNAGGSLGSMNSGSGTSNNPGVVTPSSTSTTNTGWRIGASSTQLITGGENFEIIFKPLTTSSIQSRFGFVDTGKDPVAVQDGAWIDLSNSTLSGMTASNTSSSTTGTTYTVSTGTWYRGRVVVNSDATAVNFYLYDMSGSQLWTSSLTTNIPTGSSRMTGSGVTTWSTNSTAKDLLELDYMSQWWDKDLTR